MVTGNGGRTIFNGILPGTMNFTVAGHSKTTAVELFENEICFIDNFYGQSPGTITYTDPASPHGATRVLVYSDQNNRTAGQSRRQSQ